jgi:hypothetical protein
VRPHFDRLLFAAITRNWDDGTISSYSNTLEKHDSALPPAISASLQSIDAKAAGLLTHVSMMIAGLGLMAPLVSSSEFELSIIFFEIAVYLLIALGCLRCLSVFRSKELFGSAAADELVGRELIIRRELYAICNRVAIVFTLFVFIFLPFLFLWKPAS